MGQETGRLLTGIFQKNDPSSLQFEPLRSVHRGINLRTAQHLGVEISSETEDDFKVIIK